ncbi:hypothetical protein AbraIFM66951_007957 [Aspergillus brasiliensis]|uniref:Uncharacterized protein n=1 Tax=Aspergillus brasiliensis TaxID=319629 RepID=A0A9W6DM45_9EURO|nr:hypothetical protein AbraCBS73388_008463 [Aspergillus brasiliensis]GKZ45340.1 hypothetical protein AbraIFM66951_007957 [Aspergillus brasiliensis]
MDNQRLTAGLDHVVTYWNPLRRQSVEWTPPGATSSIIPSVVAYPNGEHRVSTYGDQALDQTPRYTWTKMMVEGSPVVPVAGLDLNALLGGHDAFNYQHRRLTTKLISNFLSNIRVAFSRDRAIRDELQIRNLPPIDWHFALPACWGAEGLDLMQDAINRAGFGRNDGRVFFCTEGMQTDCAKMRLPDRETACWFLTWVVSRILLDVVAVQPTQPHRLIFRQHAEQSTADCANPLIDQQLLQHLRQSLGLPLEAGDVMRVGLQAAIAAKHSFDGRRWVRVDLNLPPQYLNRHYRGGCDAFDRGQGQFIFSQDVLHGILGPVVTLILNRIIALIAQHNPNKIVIVGGLSRSPYLRARVSAMLTNRYPGIKLVPMESFRGNDAITALAHGLAINGATIIHPMEFCGQHTYEVVTPDIAELGTELIHVGETRKTAIEEAWMFADGTVRQYHLRASWRLEHVVHARFVWTFHLRNPPHLRHQVGPEVGTITHDVVDLIPHWAQ